MSSNKREKVNNTFVERLVVLADAIFERANKLEQIKLSTDEEEVEASLAETRDDAFGGCIEIWRIIVDMLPTSGLDQPHCQELEIDGYKVISRCFHRLGKLDSARESITKAIDLGYLDGFISLGAICLDLQDFDGAKQAFESAIAKDVHGTRAHAGLGEMYFKMGTEALKADPEHTANFNLAEEQFILAGKERFADAYERAIDLFETIGWRDKAISMGEKAATYYSENRGKYGDRLRSVDTRLRKLAGQERYEKLLSGVGRKLGSLMGGKDTKDE